MRACDLLADLPSVGFDASVTDAASGPDDPAHAGFFPRVLDTVCEAITA
ncbi:hypothetical protein ACFOY2_35105 [Nonomuraea purpurea]|uniref:Uncharacterized protein n=1 Tax=Nonomuraea purpurea TaxID=1849276 RepID=A0ABV8GK15_9ACTN